MGLRRWCLGWEKCRKLENDCIVGLFHHTVEIANSFLHLFLKEMVDEVLELKEVHSATDVVIDYIEWHEELHKAFHTHKLYIRV